MAGFFDAANLTITCKNCGRKTEKSIGWIKANHEFACSCGTRIRLDSDQFTREIGKADRAIASFKDALKKIKI